MNRDPLMHKWTGNDVLETEHEARRELDHYVALPDVSTWLIVDNASAIVMGRFFLTLDEIDGQRVVGEGNRIARPFWRKGHNRAARALMFRYAFDELDAQRIETGVWAPNVNSVRSIEAHGFVLVRQTAAWNAKHRAWIDMRHYELTQARWRRGVCSKTMGEDARDDD